MRGAPITESRAASAVARPRHRAKLWVLLVLNLGWAAFIRRFESGGVYWLLGGYALGVSALLWATHGALLRARLRPSARTLVIGLLAGVGMTALTYPIYSLAVDLLPALSQPVAELYTTSHQETRAVEVFWMVVILTAEELLWRGAWPETLEGWVSPEVASVSSLVLYALAQGATGSWIVLALALVCGAFWTLLARWTRSLVPPLLAHLIWTPTVIVLVPLA